ncbi:hypothetical protein GCM10010294_67690 [Streptomyces griseoloalbus]|uniref:hypothetical protein n=1 Tax=Streptomyces griseoloalbus TaxID=67303 RepID=UPI0018763EC3|nr:hypothetical protein GCM10010294_67690 [Streptomyces griseoloalbus]
MAALDIVTVPVNGGIGLEDSAVAASAGGDTAPVGPGRFLYVMNGDAAPHTATVATPGTASGLPLPEVAVVVPAGESAILPLTAVFRGVNGRASVTYDAVTAVSVAVFELER